jgi:hypothetical protein
MNPITKVVDEEGRVLHDCDEAGCDVSWDGRRRGSHRRVRNAPTIPDHVEDQGDGSAVIPTAAAVGAEAVGYADEIPSR